eukprot:jgi/Bigna1/79875/fgenesh1_pg.66_\
MALAAIVLCAQLVSAVVHPQNDGQESLHILQAVFGSDNSTSNVERNWFREMYVPSDMPEGSYLSIKPNPIIEFDASIPDNVDNLFNTEKELQSVLIIQIETRHEGFLESGKKINKMYADKQRGVSYRSTSRFTQEAFAELPPYWAKVKIMLEEAKASTHDFVVWLDGDAVVAEHSRRFDRLRYFDDEKTVMVVGKDNAMWYDPEKSDMLCSGVWVVRNNENGKAFLQKWWDKYEQIKSRWEFNQTTGNWACDKCKWAGHEFEQGALNELYRDGGKRDGIMHNAPWYLFNNRLTKAIGNSALANSPRARRWNEQDPQFVCHFAGMTSKNRELGMKEVLKHVNNS